MVFSRRWAERPFEVQTGQARLLPMEGLRGFSAFLVFFVHFYSAFGPRALGNLPAAHEFFRVAAAAGHCGVDVFFALSGFIIYGLILEKEVSYIPFIRRRIRRLYPVFSVVFLLYLAVDFVRPYRPLPARVPEAIAYLAANFLLLPGMVAIVPLITVAWSLSYEMFFYLTLPAALRWLRVARWRRPARIAAILAGSGGILLLSHAAEFPYPRLAMFGCGMLLRETIGWNFPWRRVGNAVAALLFGGVLLGFGLTHDQVWGYLGNPAVHDPAARMGALFVATYALGYFGLGGPGILAAALSWKWVRWFGNMSYSYYVIHGFVINALLAALDALALPAHLNLPAFLILAAGSFLVTATAAAALFLAVEKPFSLPKRVCSDRRGGNKLLPGFERAARTLSCGTPAGPSTRLRINGGGGSGQRYRTRR